MRKSGWYLFSLLIIASMLLTACGPKKPVELTGTLNVWSFTNEIRTMAIAFQGKHPGVKVVYTMIPMTNGEYQTKVKAAAGTADSPDVVALEAAFVKEWVESDLLADLSDLVPLTQDTQDLPERCSGWNIQWRYKSLLLSGHPGRFLLSPQHCQRMPWHR